MTRNEMEEFAKDYPNYSPDCVQILLINNEYNQEKVKEILTGPVEESVKEIRQCVSKIREKRQKALDDVLSSLIKV